MLVGYAPAAALDTFDDMNTYASELQLRSDQPRIAKFQTPEGHELIYLGVCHSNTPGSPTYDAISRNMSIFYPDILLLEGFSSSMIAAVKENPNNCPGEVGFAITQAIQLSIVFVGGEPERQALFDELTRRNPEFTQKKYAFYRLTILVPQVLREKNMKIEDLLTDEAEMQDLFAHIKRGLMYEFKTILSDEFDFTYEEYMEWLLTQCHGEMTPEKLNEITYCSPLARGVNRIRDEHILKTIIEHMKIHKKVMVIYGRSHLHVQLPVLERYFGKPEITEPI